MTAEDVPQPAKATERPLIPARPAIQADGARMKRHLHATRRASTSRKAKAAFGHHHVARHGLRAHP